MQLPPLVSHEVVQKNVMLQVWTERKVLFDAMHELDTKLNDMCRLAVFFSFTFICFSLAQLHHFDSECFRNFDSSSKTKPDVSDIQRNIRVRPLHISVRMLELLCISVSPVGHGDLSYDVAFVSMRSKTWDAFQHYALKMDLAYGCLGSLFRSGNRLTFFASQVERYADVYAASCCNLIYYPFFYIFRSPPMLVGRFIFA